MTCGFGDREAKSLIRFVKDVAEDEVIPAVRGGDCLIHLEESELIPNERLNADSTSE